MRSFKMALIAAFATAFFIACATNPDSETTTRTTKTKTSPTPMAQASFERPSPEPGTNSGIGVVPSPTPAAATQPQASGTQPQASGADASQLFIDLGCVKCHGPDGKGVIKVAPDFTNKARMAKETDDAMASTIKNGHKPMPAFGSKLSDDQVKSLVAYVRTFAK